MKLRKLICPVLILLCLVLLFGYQAWDSTRTDTTPPELHIPETVPQVSITDGASVLIQGVTATDDADGDVTGSIVVEKIILTDKSGQAAVTIAAFDSSGNVSKGQLAIRYTDYESPRFSLSAPLVFAYNSSFDVLNIIQAQDVFNGTISHWIRATSLDRTSISTEGVHQVQFRVTNTLGDTSVLTLPVEVYASGIYQGSLTLTDYLIYLPQDSSFRAESYLKSYTLGSSTVDLSRGLPSGYSLKINGTVDPATPGVYAVSYKLTYTDEITQNSYTGYTQLIVVVEG